VSYLVDANVLSESTRLTSNPNVFVWIQEHENDLFISVITVGELERGVALYPQSRKRGSLERWLRELLLTFEGKILPIDLKVAQRWGQYYAEQERRGQKPPSLDSLIAATASVYGLTVVTRNTTDFPGVSVFNPW
jgi:toxin FitB